MADKSKGAALPPNARKYRRKPEKNEVRFGARALLFQMAGVDLTAVEGISETTALVILSEIGVDLSAFPHEKNFVSWLGLCPQHRGSAGKIFKRRRRRGASAAFYAVTTDPPLSAVPWRQDCRITRDRSRPKADSPLAVVGPSLYDGFPQFRFSPNHSLTPHANTHFSSR